MLILSWNVAGLSTTVNRIHDNYSSSSVAKSSASQQQSSALSNFFARHGADIICLQEHKIPKQQLVNRSEPRQAATICSSSSSSSTTATPTTGISGGYESFWACCLDERKKGLNGVVTYARTGTVIAANGTTVLNSRELDQQGRCVMTDHGTFVLFNVYVPCSGGQPLEYKMKFLNALRRAMQEQRAAGKPVILVGDLNISYGRNDIYWKDRVVHVNDILEEVAAATSEGDNARLTGNLPDADSWKLDVARHWRAIEAVLQTKEVVSTITTNSRTRETYNKYRLAVTAVDDNSNSNRRVFLGDHENVADYCTYRYEFSGSSSYLDEETGAHVPVQEENAVRVAVLAELMSKIARVQWSDQVIRHIADSAAAGVERLSPTRSWLRAVMEEDGMVDTFRHFYPTAEARFTCWNQNKNRRYVNDGSRIDYTLVDSALLPHVLPGDVSTLRCCGDMEAGEELTEKAALQAATANGRFQPVSFEGGGMTEASQEALDTQFGPPHTGHVYTPPTFSDHIGVSLLLDDAVLPTRDLVLNTDDAATRKAQPHKQQKTIASYFQSGSATTATSTSSIGTKIKTQTSLLKGSAAKRAKTIKPPANSVLHHFRKET